MGANPNLNPKVTTIGGRLSFPNFTYQLAVARNAKSKYPKDAAEVTPDFNVLLEQHQLDQLVAHVKSTFLPYCVDQFDKGEKRDALAKADAERLIKLLDSGDWAAQPPYICIKAVSEKTQELAPEAVASVKVVGNRGIDIEQKAIVRSKTELEIPEDDLLDSALPVIRPISATVFQMYGGCYVGTTINLYAFMSGSLPGFSASASTVVFKTDGDRFGGGMAVDEEAIFMD